MRMHVRGRGVLSTVSMPVTVGVLLHLLVLEHPTRHVGARAAKVPQRCDTSVAVVACTYSDMRSVPRFDNASTNYM